MQIHLYGVREVHANYSFTFDLMDLKVKTDGITSPENIAGSSQQQR